jgi:cobalt-zinc-cadmium efflux system outer membrane protein
MQRAISYLVIVLVALSSVSFTDAQSTAFQKDTLQLPLDSAENIFLQNNLLLLAQKYNIDAAKALIIQAKLYPNPNISFSSVFYQTQTKKILPVGSDGETN